MNSTAVQSGFSPHAYAQQLRAYMAHALRPDLFAGFTVAMVALPQSMAYAAIAGVPPIYGFYTSIVPAIIGAIFGSSRYLITGPTNPTALVVASVLAGVSGHPDYIQFVFALAILSGLIKLVLGLLRLGWIIRYVSNSVLTGFLAGVSILIVLTQSNNLLGLPRASSPETVTVVWEAVNRLGQVNLYVVLTAALTGIVLVALKRLDRRLPSELIAMSLAALFVRIAGWDALGVRLVRDLGSFENIGLAFHVPQVALADWQWLAPTAGAVALFGLVEAMSIAKAVGLSSGERLDPSREFIGQGLATLAGGFSQSIPASGSPSRTAVNRASGARTRFAAAFSGLIVLLILLVFAPLLTLVPVASLAAIIVVSVTNLIDRRHLALTWRSRTTSRVTLAATFLATLVLPLHLAIYLGALLTIVIYLYESGSLQLSYLTENGDGKFVEHRFQGLLKNPPRIAIVNVEGALYFGAVDDLEDKLDTLFRAGVKVAILRMRRVHMLGSTGAAALARIAANARHAGARVMLCGVREQVAEVLESSGAAEQFGPDEIFKADDTLFESTRLALQRAKQIDPTP